MKNVIEGTYYIKGTTVMEWLREAKEIIETYPRIAESTLRIEHSFTRYGFKVSYISIADLLKKIEKYPHTRFEDRPEIIKLIHRLTERIDSLVEYEKSKTVEVIRLSDGKHLMVTEDMAKDVIEMGVAKYA